MEILKHLNIPSPVTQVSTEWSEKAGIALSIKRDDLIHPIISGNKWRKLSGFLQDYDSTTYESIVTYGGAFSSRLSINLANVFGPTRPSIVIPTDF